MARFIHPIRSLGIPSSMDALLEESSTAQKIKADLRSVDDDLLLTEGSAGGCLSGFQQRNRDAVRKEDSWHYTASF